MKLWMINSKMYFVRELLLIPQSNTEHVKFVSWQNQSHLQLVLQEWVHYGAQLKGNKLLNFVF